MADINDIWDDEEDRMQFVRRTPPMQAAAAQDDELTETAKRIAWSHWKHHHKDDAALEPEDLWEAIGPKNRAGYIVAAKAARQEI